MIVYLANKAKFREDILSNRIEEIVHESFQGRNKLTGTLKKSCISNLFVGSGNFTETLATPSAFSLSFSAFSTSQNLRPNANRI